MGKKIIFVFLAVMIISKLVSAQYERPGSTDAQFLKIGVSARATGMGDAYIAIAKGAEATYYNASAVARIEGTDLAFNHTSWFAGINHDFAAIAHSFGRYGTFGLSVTALYTDEMQVRTPLQPDGTGETFYASNYRFGITYARHLTDRVTFGATINYIRMPLYSEFAADAYSVDIAVLYVSNFRGFRFGMKIANFGSEVKYVNESYPLPTNFTFGMAINAVRMNNQKLLISLSALKPNDGRPLGQMGAEWNLNDLLFLRTGYHFNYDVATYSFGGGIMLDIRNYNFKFDYSYSDFSLLGGTHRFGIGFKF